MSSKQNSPTSPGTNPQTLKIGSRVRCTDDGVEGRIVWANAVAVKIRWDDGEQVTWRRDSLADRPIEILDPEQAGDEEHPAEAAPAETAAATARAEAAEGTMTGAAVEQATGADPTPTAMPDSLVAETSADAAATEV